MSRAWRLSGQTAFESELLEALSLLLLRAGLRTAKAAELITREELDDAASVVKGLLAKFLETYRSSLPGGSPGSVSLSAREHAVFRALKSALLSDWDSLEGLLQGALHWLARPELAPGVRELDFLRRFEVIVASDLHSWYSRLRGAH